MTASQRNHQEQQRSTWQRATARVAPIFVTAILFVVAIAALAAPQAQYQNQNQDRDRYREQDRDHDRDHDRDGDRDHNRGGVIFILGFERNMRDFGGGNGGRPAPDALCDPGFVAVGFHVQTGEFYNQAWLECAPMRSDASLGDERRLTGRTGSPGGAPVHDARCSYGKALRGLAGRTGASIDQASGECTNVRDIAQRFENPPTELTQPVSIPRPGGRPAQADCPTGSVVTGFRAMSGEYMDHLWILCSELHRSY